MTIAPANTADTGIHGTGTSTEDPRRHLALPGTFNLRDVGGYPTRDGGSIRWRTLLRSDALHRMTDSTRGALAQLGLRQVVDLRSADEVGRAPDALGRMKVTVTGAPVFAGAPVNGTAPASLEGVYQYMIDHCGTRLAAAVVAVASGGDSGCAPVLVHCSAGKDRTGLVVALILDVLGVSDEHIAADFALTAQYLRPDDEAVLRQLAEGTGSDHSTDAAMLACPPDLILNTVNYLREQHGSARAFLLRHGVHESTLDRLCLTLVKSA